MRNGIRLAILFGFIAACSSTPGIKLSSTTVKSGEPISVTYTSAVKVKEGSKYWVTLAPKASQDSTWGDWHYVSADATSDTLKAGQPGEYEIRLHDDYPKQPFHVIARQTIKVE